MNATMSPPLQSTKNGVSGPPASGLTKKSARRNFVRRAVGSASSTKTVKDRSYSVPWKAWGTVLPEGL